jgi:hypothetical protein
MVVAFGGLALRRTPAGADHPVIRLAEVGRGASPRVDTLAR